ncbi:DUF2812 domain-containing protein [Streptococcus dentiloxodontae]
MKKFKVFLSSIASQEKWINSIQSRGYRLTKVSSWLPLYTFEKTAKEPPIVRLDFKDYISHDKFVDYLTLFEDSGWKHIAGSRWGGIQYFQQMGDGGSEEIFSDEESEKMMIKRFCNYAWEQGLCCFLLVYCSFSMNFFDLLAPEKWDFSNLFDLLFFPLTALFLIPCPVIFALSSLYYLIRAARLQFKK